MDSKAPQKVGKIPPTMQKLLILHSALRRNPQNILRAATYTTCLTTLQLLPTALSFCVEERGMIMYYGIDTYTKTINRSVKSL